MGGGPWWRGSRPDVGGAAEPSGRRRGGGHFFCIVCPHFFVGSEGGRYVIAFTKINTVA